MLTRAQKEEQVADLKDKFGRATSVVVAQYSGLSVQQMEALRGELRKVGEGGETEYRVAKNSVLRLAAKGGPAEAIEEHFVGPTAIAMSFGDPVGLAKAVVGYAEKNEAFQIRGALLEGKPLDEAQVAKLATMPSLLELRARLAGLVQAPASKLARLLNEPGAQLARLVAARKDSLAEGGEG